MTGPFHLQSAAGWAECTVASPRRVRRLALQFSEESSTPLIGHSRALSEVLTRLLSTQTNFTQQGTWTCKLSETRPAPARTSGPACLISRWELSRDRGAVGTTPAHRPLCSGLPLHIGFLFLFQILRQSSGFNVRYIEKYFQHHYLAPLYPLKLFPFFYNHPPLPPDQS